MDPPPKKKSKKDILAENLIEMIDRNPSSAALLLLTVVLLPWSMDFVSPSLKFLCVVLGPHIWRGTGTAWRGTADWMTQPILFVLMNVMIFSIMLSSGTISLASSENGDNSREKHSSSGMRFASTKEQHNISKSGLMRSQSISEELARKDSFPSNPSFASQASEGGVSSPLRHSRSLSLPLTEAENWSTSSFSISTSKQHQSPSMQVQSVPETYREEKLLHTVENSSRFSVQNEEEDEATFVNFKPLMELEKKTAYACVDPRRFKEEREANAVYIKPYVEKKTANVSIHPRHFKEANAVIIKPVMNTEKKTAYGWAARRGLKEENKETSVDNKPVLSVEKMIANACVEPQRLDWQNHLPEQRSFMHTNSTSEALLEPRTASTSSEKGSSSSAFLQKRRVVSDISSVAVDNDNRSTSPSDGGNINRAVPVNEKDELNVRIEAFLARHRRQRQQEMIESLQQFSGSKTSRESKLL
ncbi:hypothetical protein O6H91_06G074200 [Diphasiastrum complanatum]|uniref:Uncharacterized protein n=2 Tax=Diphasiastrum complanatum TaxID=34168 RepID=A0ACC2DF42_DIPCM|nr:hypothetical protein O6H91_06G074200 [Diphasiastrum complanatum]